MDKDKQDYTPRPFTQEVAEQSYINMFEPLDDKRTLCNVIKQAYRCVQDESYNLNAARDLLLEALWMGKRMHDKLYLNQKMQVDVESVEEDEEFTFSVDWSKMDSFPAQGNWD